MCCNKKSCIVKLVTCWSHIAVKSRKAGNCLLHTSIRCFPKCCICTTCCRKTSSRKNIQIIRAEIPQIRTKRTYSIIYQNNKPTRKITKKINMFINLKWDDDYCDGKGGVRLDEFARCIKEDVIHISYIKKDEPNLTIAGLNVHVKINKHIRHMTIDFKNDMLYRNMNYDQPEEILFGEIPFL